MKTKRGMTYTFASDESRDKLRAVMAMVKRFDESGGIAREAIGKELSMHPDTVYLYLTELRLRDQVHPRRDGHASAMWVRGADPALPARYAARREQRHIALHKAGYEPQQVHVSTWTPHHSRDDLVSALFGKPV